MEEKVKNILLLGGFGFLGTNVIKYVDTNLSHKYKFIVFDKSACHLNGVRFDSVSKVYTGNFIDTKIFERIFNENRIDVVFHSLSTTVPVDSGNAKFDVESNLVPTLDVLDLMVKYGVNDIVYLSSGGAIYGVVDNKQHKESDDVFPVSSYGIVKLAIEKYMMQYAQLYGLKPLILRLSNPYGPYHYSMKQGVVNVAMSKALNGNTFEIWGDGNGKKDYIYVEDFVRIVFKLIDEGIYNKVLNIASGQSFSVNEIVRIIMHMVPCFKVEYKDSKMFDANHFELDTTQLKQILPDITFTSIEEGLNKTYAWASKK